MLLSFVLLVVKLLTLVPYIYELTKEVSVGSYRYICNGSRLDSKKIIIKPTVFHGKIMTPAANSGNLPIFKKIRQ